MTNSSFYHLHTSLFCWLAATMVMCSQPSLAGQSASRTAKSNKAALIRTFENDLESILRSLDLRKARNCETIKWDDQNIPASFYSRIGLSYLAGRNGAIRDDFKALLYLKIASDEQDPWADFGLAICRKRGLSITHSSEEAVMHLMTSASNGLAPAKYALAKASLCGYGINEDKELAKELLSELAENGSPSAISMLKKCCSKS